MRSTISVKQQVSDLLHSNTNISSQDTKDTVFMYAVRKIMKHEWKYQPSLYQFYIRHKQHQLWAIWRPG